MLAVYKMFLKNDVSDINAKGISVILSGMN